MRYFLEFAYKGTNYHGWQYQPNAISVQQTLQKALTTILKTEIELVGAGRTDTGVHASQMFAHFDIENPINKETFIYKANAFLPKDIAICNLHTVAANAHARFDAISRTYHYHIHQHKNVFKEDGSYFFQQKLDLQKMNKACKLLLHHTDFECFSKVHTDVNTFHCNIMEANWKESQDAIVFTITADRFLRNMVRAIVGTMINIGTNKINLTDLEKILESKDRSKAGFSAPATGLFLSSIKYPYLPKYES